MTITPLKNKFGQVQQSNLTNEVVLLDIKHRYCHAKISLYGGQVLSWKPNGQKDVFWLSRAATFEQGKAIRGGIPLCWPWFGAHPDDISHKEKNHGFIRNQIWRVDNIDIKEESVDITLILQGGNMHSLWPHCFKLKQVLSFGKHFKQSLTMTNLSHEDAYYSGAFHSYFSVSAPENAVISKLNEVPFDDKLTGQYSLPKPLLNSLGPIDRVYHANAMMQIIDSKWQRIIEVSASNTQQWVFWNPGVVIANTMIDLHDSGEQEFVCLEAANTSMQLLTSGKAVTMAQTIKVLANDKP
ncbi:MAG: D-hexose-6-phosphate mutarotase [Colwellia sp.]|nr:D-hexose-6-phosphate mutarotase [Colwellia sp.]